jgi:hypothetical protein
VKPLLRKDAPWLLAFGVGGLIFALLIHAAQEGPWVRPDQKFIEAALAFHWVAATLLGLMGAMADDLTRTREYLLHRNLSRARLFWSRQLGGLVVVALWVLLVPAVHLVLTLIFRDDRFLVEPGRYWRLVDESTPAFVFYAVGAFSGTVVRRPVWAVPLAAITTSATLLLFLPLVFDGAMFMAGVPSFVVALPLAAAFLLAAVRSERDGREADRPWTRARLLTAGVLLVGFAVPGISFVLGAMEQASVEGLFKHYPFIGQRSDGEGVLYVRHKQRRKLLAVDNQHQVIGELEPEAIVRSWNPDRIHDRGEPLTIGTVVEHGRRAAGHYTSSWYCPGQLSCYISSDGYVDLVRETPDSSLRDWGEPVRLRAGHPPDNQPFAPHVMPIGNWWQGTAFMADLQAGVLWAADLSRDEPRFAVMPLPGGDRLRLDLTMDVAQDSRFRHGPPPALVIAGERGFYTLAPSEMLGEPPRLVVAPPVIAALAERSAKFYNKDVQVTLQGVTRASVTVRWRDGGPVLHHDYAPRRPLEHLLAASLYTSALLRPPLFAVASLAVPVPPAHNPAATWVFASLARSMSWLVFAGNLLLGLILAARTWRRLGEYQTSGARRWWWAVVVFLGGVPAFVCLRFIETRRAWLPAAAPADATAVPPLLIQSA